MIGVSVLLSWKKKTKLGKFHPAEESTKITSASIAGFPGSIGHT